MKNPRPSVNRGPGTPLPRRRRNRGGRLLVVFGVVIVGGGLAWWWWAGAPPTLPSGVRAGMLPRGVAPTQLNLLVVTFDTTRADRVGTYGYPGGSTPNIDRLASRGVVFENAQAAIPLTLPAHTTIFTGLWPPAHGVRDNGGFIVPDRLVTLAEALKAHGYATGAFVGAFVLDSKWGLNQGFDKYFDKFDLGTTRVRSMGDIARRANEVVDQALPWLQEHGRSRFFAWIHLYDPHSPYDPPEPFKSRFANRPYVGEIAFADFEMGRVLDWLDSSGLSDRTVVVVLGDHGESLGEHGEATHAFFIYEAALRVPFVVASPYRGTGGRRVKTLAREVDVFPTVLDLLGLKLPEPVQGESLSGLMFGTSQDGAEREGYAESFYPRYHFGWSELRSLTAGRFKYIDAPSPELYDIEQDPRENTNLAKSRASIALAMSRRLHDLEKTISRADTGQAAHREVDAETRARLASLGYVGSFVPDTRPGSTLADPKDRIDLFNKLNDARERMTAEKPDLEGAISMLEAITREDPTVIDAWTTLGNAYGRKAEYARAVDYYKRALELNPTYDVAVIELAQAYRGLGKPREALAAYEVYLKSDPNDGGVHYQLGQVYLDLGDLDAAERSFRRALELNSTLAAAQTDLGVIAYKRGDLDTAERTINAALAIKADVRLAHYNLGQIAEDRGQVDRAQAEYRKEIELHKESYLAHYQLGRLLDRMGQRAVAVQEYRAAVDANPKFGEGYLLLAKTSLDAGDLTRAITESLEGLKLSPRSEFAPLGHYVLADAYNRLGRRQEAAREAALGHALESKIPGR